MATWDLDHVATEHEWELLFTDEPDEEAVEHLDGVAPNHSGTVVVWTKVDRLITKNSTNTRRALERRRTGLIEHLAMVYQRFLNSKDKRATDVTIKVNGEDVKEWDPFQVGYSELLASETVKAAGTKAEFKVRAYLLPRPEEFPNDEAAKAAKIATTRQGIYVYRQERLIHEGDWLGMFQIEPHFNLLRVEFSFTHELDDFFHLDIKKSQIILDDELWAWLKDQFLPAPLHVMSKTDIDGRNLFESVMDDCVSSGAAVSLRINGADVDYRSSAAWPIEWARFGLALRRGQLELGADEGTNDEQIVREWMARFAAAILALLPLEAVDTSEPDVTGYPEGSLVRIEVNRYERDRRNRAAALAIHGRICKGCGMTFEGRYGDIAAGFIEVHHITPVSMLGPSYLIDVKKDLVPLCPNCHAVVHRRSPPLPVEELVEIVRKRS